MKKIKNKVDDIAENKQNGSGYRIILQTALDGFYIVDMHGYISDVNDSYCSMIGYSREELLKMKVKDIEAVDSEEMVARRIQKILKVGWDRFETKHRRKDGKIIEIEASVRYSKDGAGKFFVFMHDITERKRIDQSMRLNSEIINNISEGVYLVRLSDGKIVYANSKFEKMFGYDKGEIIGKDVIIVNASGEKSSEETAKEIIGILNKTGEWRGEVENIRKNGARFWCYANCSVFNHFKYGKVIVAVHTDITERKKIEEDLSKKTKELEDKNKKLEVREQEINKALENSEKANKMMVGRELRMRELKLEIIELRKKIENKK